MLKPKITDLITEEDYLQGELISDVKHELMAAFTQWLALAQTMSELLGMFMLSLGVI